MCMTAMGTMFDHKCKPLFNYGTGYRNTIKWSNSGRYVALCGFGNLPGDIGARRSRFIASTAWNQTLAMTMMQTLFLGFSGGCVN